MPAIRCRSTREISGHGKAETKTQLFERREDRHCFHRRHRRRPAAAGKDRAGVPAHEAAGAGAAHDSRRGSATFHDAFPTWQASKCGPTCTTCSSTSRAATSRWCRAACHLHGAGRDPPAVPQLSFAAPLRAERARAPAARELRRRPLRFIRGPHARGARRRARSRRCTRRCATSRWRRMVRRALRNASLRSWKTDGGCSPVPHR